MAINLNKGILAKIRAFFVPVDTEVLKTVEVVHMVPKTTVPAYSFDFGAGRKVIFKSGYTQRQVDSINAIVSECNKQGVAMPEQVAYILATAWHESRLEPIKEWGSDKYLYKYDTGKLAKDLGNTPEADGDGQFYAGRGFVMITGRNNYAKYQEILGVPILDHPDIVLEIPVSAFIIVDGMMNGRFTGRKLPDYVNENKIDYVNARRVVNGTDRAQMIADYARQFEVYVKSA